jgi:AhpD family alkylhydroperoxidase
MDLELQKTIYLEGNLMSRTVEYQRIAPDAEKSLAAMEQYIKESHLDPALVELVKYRVAQINGCPACLNKHSKLLLEEGENAQRLHTVSAWRATDYYSERERAALAWAEGLTRVSELSAQDRDRNFEQAKAVFSEKELVDLTMTVIAINSWNRLHIAFSVVPALVERTGGVKAAS